MSYNFVFLEKLFEPLMKGLFLVLAEVFERATDLGRVSAHFGKASARIFSCENIVRTSRAIEGHCRRYVKDFGARVWTRLHSNIDRMPLRSVVLCELLCSEEPRRRAFHSPRWWLHAGVFDTVPHEAKCPQYYNTPAKEQPESQRIHRG